MPRYTKSEMLDRFGGDMARLLRAVETLTEAERLQPIYGDWTSKDVLAHIAAWDRALLHGLDEVLAGRRAQFAGYREAEFNARALAASRDAPFSDVRAELLAAHEALVARVEVLAEAAWVRTSSHRWGDGTPMTPGSVFDYVYKGETHYGGHATEIEAWLAAAAAGGANATGRARQRRGRGLHRGG
jgi:hypothetical protein